MKMPRPGPILCGLWIGLLAAPLQTACAQGSAVPLLSVDVAAARVAISPDIYGIASYGLDAAFAKEIQVGNVRWGGDGTSRYNWEVDSSNAGYDFYFMGGSGAATAPIPGGSPDAMVSTYSPANAHALITIPILPYINKSYAWSCSFPVSQYGSQTATNPYVFPVVNGVKETCGNSLATVAVNGSTQLMDTNILANHVPNSPSLQQDWVKHLLGKFGTGAAGGVKYYQLDNEPLGWSNTHRDVQPATATYATIVQLGESYAAAVKQADGSALVLGPSDFTLGGWVGTSSQQGGLWAGQYYLQQMAAYEQSNHLRILDYFDEHYYFDTSTPAAQLASTRTLWDPTYNGGTWVEQYDFKGPMQLIPRFKSWIASYYPGTKLAISEYSIDSGTKSIVDAIAEMDVLGIYGREQLDFANMWNTPAPTDPIAYAFRMFRNYDGGGHAFGDTSIGAVSSNQSALSIYAAQRSTDNAVTILAINKTSASITSAITLANLNLPATAQVYSYSAANLKAIVQSADTAISGTSLGYTFPGYSAVLFVVQPGPLTTVTSLTASPLQLVAGATVALSTTVTVSEGTPTGSVSLRDGTILLGTVSLTNGGARLSVGSLAVGTHTITASYVGNSLDAPSSSSVVVQVSAAPVSTATALVIKPLTSESGQPVLLAATVSPATGTMLPTGSIVFQEGSTRLGASPLVMGAATLTVTNLSVGSHSLTALYEGDGADIMSTSPAQIVTVTAGVVPPPPPASSGDYALSLSSDAVTATQAGSAIMTVTVAPQGGFSGLLSFACSGLPAEWMCSFAPATLSGATSQMTTLTVHAVTNSANASQSFSGMLLAMVSPWPLLLIGVGTAKPRVRRVLRLLLVAALLAGCGGGSGSDASSAPPTPSSSYTVTVSASGSAAPTHSQTFTLTLGGS